MEESVEIPADAPRPRLCHLRKWPDFVGYGFNLHAEKGKPGQFIGKVDADSPAAVAGLREGDRIVEVNGTNVGQENHHQVVQRIKAVENETKFLVLDPAADAFYRERKIVVSGKMPNVEVLETPPMPPNSADNTANSSNPDAEMESNNSDSAVSGTSTPTPLVVPDGGYRARQCELRTWPDFAGYGFNLHAERGKPEQFIGKVDPGSPSAAAGLREGDRIVAVNGENVVGLPHQDVVSRIRAESQRVTLLVVDPAADVFFRQCSIVPSISMEQIDRIACPDTNPGLAGKRGSNPSVVAGAPPSYQTVTAYPTVTVEKSSSSPVPANPEPADVPPQCRPRLCHVRSWRDGRGFGFNMQAERGKPGQFIGKVDSGSPAEAAGLREGDRIVEVNGVDVQQDKHKEVVEKIKAISDETRLLVVDREADRYFAEKGVAISSRLECVERITCPLAKPITENGKSPTDETDSVSCSDYEKVTDEMAKIANDVAAATAAAENGENGSPFNSYTASTGSMPTAATGDVQTPSAAQQPVTPTFGSPGQRTSTSSTTSKSSVVVSGLEFASSVEEARRRMTKKRDVRACGMSIKDKYDLFQKL